MNNEIPVRISFRNILMTDLSKNRNVKIIKRSNKLIQALQLPVIANLNPRSVYNKVDEFHAFIEQEERTGQGG